MGHVVLINKFKKNLYKVSKNNADVSGGGRLFQK